MLDRHRDSRISVKRQGPGQHLIHNYAQRVNIGAGIYMAPFGLLWGDIMDRAQGLLGQCALYRLQAGNAKIGHLHTAVF